MFFVCNVVSPGIFRSQSVECFYEISSTEVSLILRRSGGRSIPQTYFQVLPQISSHSANSEQTITPNTWPTTRIFSPVWQGVVPRVQHVRNGRRHFLVNIDSILQIAPLSRQQSTIFVVSNSQQLRWKHGCHDVICRLFD